MSARTEKRRQGGISKERLILALIVVAVVIGLTALGLHLNGSLTLDNLLVELGLKEPAAVTISIDDIPEYSGEPYVILQDNQPDFDLEDLTLEPFETYSELDSLGRCGVAYANICLEIMPTEPRGDIGQVKPSGWQTVKYDCVDGKYLYNRCHLIGYQLAGENANKQNLITGTRYMNVVGMLPFENMVDDYVEETENHVLYRVTPVFDGDNLVASGVQMEAFSVEDEGEGVCFNVFVYNVQPGIVINYATGESWEE
ncbi:MAG: DNA/RNA non-specific endonuclease [Oscillospiraceae bacterium]|nr:DNA/RNA non-specific endonuclease [Oscillospiraceae bacterium]